MIKAAMFPGRYVQGAGALSLVAEELRRLGERPVVVCDPYVYDALREEVAPHFAGAPFLRMGGEITRDEIARLAEEDATREADVVVGLGGGRANDAGRALAHRLGARVAIVPSVAATDSPCSSQAVLRDAAGEVDRHVHLGRDPDLVLVDTALIAKAPARFLRAGIGDALSTRLEAEASAASGAPNMTGHHALDLSLALARRCRAVLFADAEAALAAVEADAVTPALERVVEAVVLLSGLGFESGGLATPHALEKGLARLPGAGAMHGERVAFATLVAIVLAGADEDEIAAHVAFAARIGLPTTLAALGCAEASPEDVAEIARWTCRSGSKVENEAFRVTPERLADAIRVTDARGHAAAHP
jgi:glycerol dehydrogenase